MIVGVVKLRLRLHGNNSLKGKRKIMKSISERLHRRFSLAVAETDVQDIWQTGELGIAVVGNESRYIVSKLDKAINFVEDMQIAEVVDIERDLIHF